MVLTALHLRTHGAGGFDKADIALYGCCAHALDTQGRGSVCSQGASGNKVAGRRGIGLDKNLAWRLVTRTLRDGEALPPLALHHNAKLRQQFERDVDIGLGNQLAHHLNADSGFGSRQRQSQQQRG